MKTFNEEKIKPVDDFKYLGSYIASTERDAVIRFEQEWRTLNEFHMIWKPKLPDRFKGNFLRAVEETVLAFGLLHEHES